jgi:uncharacterized RDD family membrane protein YckC
MTQIPAGWYPDPAPEAAPGRQRYWDGSRWTEHIHDPQPAPPAPAYPQAYPPAYPQSYPQTLQYAQPAQKQARTTPDGQPLASWGERVVAQLIDGVILNVLALVVWVPVVTSQWDEMQDWFTAVDRLDPETDDTLPRLPDFINPAGARFWELVAVTLIIGAVYTISFWRWKQATPGKLAMGLRIRRREPPGDFPWSAIGLRYGATVAFSVIGVLSLLDVLWPLWDDKRQALHDKVAGTNVISVRRHEPDVTEAGLPPRW